MVNCCRPIVMFILLAAAAAPVCGVEPAKKSERSKPAAPEPRDTVLVVVNGQKITESDLKRRQMTRQVPDDEREKMRGPMLEEIIDARLMQQFLASRKTTASKQEIDEQVNRIRDAARQRGSDPDKTLAELGYTAQSLRDEFALPLAWKRHVDRAIPPARLKAYFDEHRAEFDGTKVRSRQILIKVPPGDDEAGEAAKTRLAVLRKQIVADKLTFEEAARENSQAPSKDEGGDVGWFPYAGKMPRPLAREVFRLKVGEISQPFRTPWGAHLCLVTDRKPGDLSLEDVRDEVLSRMSQELWIEMIAELRQSAKIDWKVDKP